MYISFIVNFPKLCLISFAVFFVSVGVSFGQCPSITVIGPMGITNPGDKIIFRVDGGAVDLTYLWSVSAGTIVEGQGTPVITGD